MRYFNTISLASAILGAGVFAGCADKQPFNTAATEGQRLEYRAEVLRDKAKMIQRGESLVRDGRAMVARGNTLKEQGNVLDGQNLITEGEAKIRMGNDYLAQADAVLLPPTAKDATLVDPNNASAQTDPGEIDR